MPTIQAKNNPASRIEAGNHVIEAAKTTDTKRIKTKLVAFAKAHTAFVAAHAAATKAERALDDAQDAVGEADGEQDAALHVLAAKMIGDGAPKNNPFKLFGLPAPSKLAGVAVEREVRLTAKLAKLAAKWKGAGAGTKQAAARLAKGSASTVRALGHVAPLDKAQAAAIARRNALGVPWARAFVQCKTAARAAEDDGARGLFAALFGVARTARAKASPAKSDGAGPPEATPPPPAAS